MNCAVPKTVHTIGHSTRGIEDFLTLLKIHAVDLVVDVRRWPASRRYPHFRRESLSESLRNENTAWKVGAFRAYADFMLTPEFEKIMHEMEPLAASKRITIMCAEAVPWRCHRQLLADTFLVRGFSVRHIMDDGCHEHHLPPFAMRKGTGIYYPASPAA
jgi:uncharacterized protein (DUF488 family)